MGMLEKAKAKKEPAKKKHEAKKPSDQSEAPQPQPEESGETEDSGEAQNPQGADQGGDAGTPGEGEGLGDDAGQAVADQGEQAAQGEGGDQEDQETQGAPPSGDGGSAQGSPQGAQGQGTSFAGQDLSKVPIPPALKEEYERVDVAMNTALYKNDQVAQAILKGVVPDGPHKIESVARMATLLVVQLNKKLGFMKDVPQITLAVTRDACMHVMDLAEQVKGISFSEQEATAVLGSAVEVILRVGGVSKKQMQAMKQHVPRSQMQSSLDQYHKTLQFTKGARPPDPNTEKGPPPPSGSSQGQGAPQAQPPGGSPAGSPQQGAPVTAAPGPGQSAPPGGMLTAAQAPQGA